MAAVFTRPVYIPHYFKKAFSSVIDVAMSRARIAILLETGEIKLLNSQTGVEIATIDSSLVAGDKILSIGFYKDTDGLILRDNIGNGYIYLEKDNKTVFKTDQVGKIVDGDFVRFSGKFAYSTELKRRVPLFKGDYINVYDGGIKQKADGTWSINIDIDEKVLKFLGKFTEKDDDGNNVDVLYYLREDMTIKKVTIGEVASDHIVELDVQAAGYVSYTRRKKPALLWHGCDSPVTGDPEIDKWLADHTKCGDNTGLHSGSTFSGSDFHIGVWNKIGHIEPDNYQRAAGFSFIWIRKSDEFSILKKSDNDVGVLDTGSMSIQNIFTYFYSNNCEKLAFMNTGKLNNIYLVDGLFASSDVPEYVSVDSSDDSGSL